jgi:hypothetical protein
MQSYCRRSFILNSQLDKFIIDIIMSIHTNLHEFFDRNEVKNNKKNA